MAVSIRTIVNSIDSRGFTGSSGPQGPQGFTGSLGYTGSIGYVGSQGQSAGYRYQFSTSILTNEDPLQGFFRFNSTTPASITQISIDLLNVGGSDLTNVIDSWDDANSVVKGYLIVDSNAAEDTTLFVFALNTITVQTGYRQLNVTYLSGATLPADSELCVVRFYRTGDIGYAGSRGPQGFTGSIGFTGSQGTGFAGSRGPQGFTGSIGFTGSQGAGFTGSASTALGPQGFTGSVGGGFTGSASTVIGFTGSIGTSTGFLYQYSNTTTASDPGTGFFRFNSLTTGSITEMYISNLDASGGTDRSAALLTLDDTSGSNRATIYIPGPATGFTVSITVTGAITNNGTWLTIPVTFNTGALPSNNELRNVIGVRNGDFGFTGSVGAGFTGSSGATGFAGSVGGIIWNGFQPHRNQVMVAAQIGQGSVFLEPIEVPVDVQFDRIVYPVNISAASNANNITHNLTIDVAVYTQNVSTLSQLHASRLTTQMTFNNNSATILYYGQKNISFPWTTTITAGEYVFGFRSSTASTASDGTWSNFVISQQASSFSGMFGVHSSVVSQQRTHGLGILSAAVGSIPSSIAYSDIRGRSTNNIRPPMFYLTSGTA